MRWTVLVPAKALPGAKSRLARAGADPGAHARLVAAIRSDTLAAVRASAPVARVVIVSDSVQALPPGADEILVQQRPGLNAALDEGAAYAAARWPGDGVAALVGDLPALRPDELADALDAAATVDRAYVPDTASSGTTLLTARPGVELTPFFGVGSAAQHAAAAQPLDAGPGLRHDVDTADDLRAALQLGVGPATLAVTASRSLRVHLGSA